MYLIYRVQTQKMVHKYEIGEIVDFRVNFVHTVFCWLAAGYLYVHYIAVY